jgi:hypothetical protein
MKKHFILIFIACVSLILSTSCLKQYLDKAPESGLTEDIVFTKYANFKSFFDAIYDGRKYYSGSWRDTWNYKSTLPLYMDTWDQKYCINSTTDACDQGRYMEGQAWKSGNMSETIVGKLCYDGARRPVLGACFDDIRICNIAIRNVKRIQDADSEGRLISSEPGCISPFSDYGDRCHTSIMLWGHLTKHGIWPVFQRTTISRGLQVISIQLTISLIFVIRSEGILPQVFQVHLTIRLTKCTGQMVWLQKLSDQRFCSMLQAR